jgi:hypothetical protein
MIPSIVPPAEPSPGGVLSDLAKARRRPVPCYAAAIRVAGFADRTYRLSMRISMMQITAGNLRPDSGISEW